MTLYGFCPDCGYPYYCMCKTCKPKAPKHVKKWESTDSIKDGLVCPHCGEVWNFDTLVWVNECNKNVLIAAMKKMCDGCMECCDYCPLAPFTKPDEWYEFDRKVIK